MKSNIIDSNYGYSGARPLFDCSVASGDFNRNEECDKISDKKSHQKYIDGHLIKRKDNYYCKIENKSKKS